MWTISVFCAILMTMIAKSELISLLDDVMKQTAKIRKGGDELVYFCLNCNHHKRKLEVCLEDGHRFGMFNCWVCHNSGSLKKLLKLANASQKQYDKLHALTGDIKSVRRSYTKKPDCGEVQLPDEFHPICQPKASVEYRNALAYLKRRSVLREDILRYNIGYCESGPYENHIIIPSYDAKGTLNFFIGRRYYDVDGCIPYKKPECSMDIVGFELFINWNEPISMCEGPFDAMAIRNNAVPLFGKYPSPKLREQMIINGTKQVNMILDDDAMKDAIKNCQMMWDLGIEVRLVKLKGKDPSKIGFEGTQEFIRNAKPFEFDDLLAHSLQL
jgi:hypothetical protein